MNDLDRIESIVNEVLSAPLAHLDSRQYCVDIARTSRRRQASQCDIYLAENFPRCRGWERRQVYTLLLVSMKGPASTEALGNIMRNDIDPRVRHAALVAAYNFGAKPYAASIMMMAATDPHSPLRDKAMIALEVLFS